MRIIMKQRWDRGTVTRLGISAGIALGLWWFTTQFPYGAYLDGWAYQLYASYANDLLQPFGLYFALCAVDVVISPLRSWQSKAALSVFIPLGMEFLQLLWRHGMGISISDADLWGLGFVFDPVDIFCYLLGVLAAAGLEWYWFSARSLPATS